MNCAQCRAAVGADARFCPVCGQPVASASSLVGREIAGRFRILAKLGEGGMGAVYRGEQISLKRPVAVKVLRPEVSRDPLLVRRFSAEAEAVAKLDHPNTVKVYDFGQDADGALFIAMEFIDGASLRAVLRQGPLPPARALAIGAQIAASLADAHAHAIVHRDLKPDNVMLQDKGRQRDVVRVLDFGIAKLRDDSRATQQATMTQAGDLLGTPQYMAPEQIRGDAVDGRTDIYALGCVMYELLTGAMAFEGPTVLAILGKHLTDAPVPPSQRRRDLALPPALDPVVLAALVKDPVARPPTMDAYGELIAAAQQQLDPNRSSPLVAVPAAAALAAPTPPSQPPFAAPAPPSQPPLQPPAYAAPTPSQLQYPHPYPYPRPRSRGPMLAVAGVLALGAAAGIAYAVRSSSEAHSAPGDAASVDPWLHETGSPAPSAPPSGPASDVPLRLTPIPDGAKLTLPPDFRVEASNSSALVYFSTDRSMLVALGQLLPISNDPDELASEWIRANAATHLHRTQSSPTEVAMLGTRCPVLWFAGVFNRVPVEQMVVLYITPQFRFGLLVQYPTGSYAAARNIVDPLLSGGIVVP